MTDHSTNTPPSRKIMRAFSINEVSAVDFPAQAGARLAILKRKYSPQGRDPHREPTTDGGEPTTFDAATAMIRGRDQCTRTEAMTAARREYPELYQAYQSDGLAAEQQHRAQVAQGIKKSASATDFEKCVSDIQARDRCSKNDALDKARAEHPAEFEAWQAA